MQKQSLSLILFFLFFIPSVAQADEDKERLREAYKIVREARKEWKRERKAEEQRKANQERASQEDLVICVECPKILDLVGDINKTMNHMLENGEISIAERGALEEVERLEGLYYIVENDISGKPLTGNDLSEGPCSFRKLDIYLKDLNSEPLRESELTEIFSFNISWAQVERIKALHFRSNGEKGRFYFYRAAPPNQDKIIRVHLPRDGRPTVTYFQMGMVPELMESDLMREKITARMRKDVQDSLAAEGEEVKKLYGMDYWGTLSEYESETSKWTYGVAMAHKDNLPRRILLVKGEDETKITENLRMRTEVELSDRHQEVVMSLSDAHRKYLTLEAEADGDYRAALPFSFEVRDFALSAHGDIAHTEEGEEATLRFSRNGSSLINMRVKKKKDGSESIHVGNEFEGVFLGGTLSVEYEKSDALDGDSEKMWLRYSQRF